MTLGHTFFADKLCRKQDSGHFLLTTTISESSLKRIVKDFNTKNRNNHGYDSRILSIPYASGIQRLRMGDYCFDMLHKDAGIMYRIVDKIVLIDYINLEDCTFTCKYWVKEDKRFKPGMFRYPLFLLENCYNEPILNKDFDKLALPNKDLVCGCPDISIKVSLFSFTNHLFIDGPLNNFDWYYKMFDNASIIKKVQPIEPEEDKIKVPEIKSRKSLILKF